MRRSVLLPVIAAAVVALALLLALGALATVGLSGPSPSGDAPPTSARGPIAPATTTRAPMVAASQPSPDLGPSQVALGLSAAALLLGIALWLVRTTDWRRPDEPDGPWLDDHRGQPAS